MYNHPPGGGKNTNKMKQVKLEVGKTYRSRKGEEVKIVRKSDKHNHPYQGSNGGWYAESGRFNLCVAKSSYDLVEEVIISDANQKH